MRVLLCLMILLPAILAANIQERFLIDVHELLDALKASGAAHDTCAALCPGIAQSAGLGSLSFLCGTACNLL